MSSATAPATKRERTEKKDNSNRPVDKDRDKPEDNDQDELRHWIYAGALPYELTEGDIICVFSQYGELHQFVLARDKDTGVSRGFCFMRYEDARSCELAVDNFNGTTLLGRRLKASFASNLNAIRGMRPVDVTPKC